MNVQAKIIILSVLLFSLGMSQNIEHNNDIEVLKREMKEIKYYLYEFKKNLETQTNEIEKIIKKSDTQSQTIEKQSLDIQELIQVVNKQDRDIKSLQDTIRLQEEQINQIKSNMKNYLSKSEMTSFLSTVDPQGITHLRDLRSWYQMWLNDNNKL